MRNNTSLFREEYEIGDHVFAPSKKGLEEAVVIAKVPSVTGKTRYTVLYYKVEIAPRVGTYKACNLVINDMPVRSSHLWLQAKKSLDELRKFEAEREESNSEPLHPVEVSLVHKILRWLKIKK